MIALAGVLAAVLMRYALTKRAEPGFDSYGHIYFAKEIKQQQAGPFEGILLRALQSSRFHKPLFFNWIVAKLPVPHDNQGLRYFNFYFDLVFTAALMIVALKIGFDLEMTIFAAAIYLTTPMWFSAFAIGPRIQVFTPRLSSEVLVNVLFCILYLPNGLGNIEKVAIGALLSFVVIVSSRFGTQVLILLVPFITLFSFEWQGLVAVGTGFLLVFVVTKGLYLSSVLYQINHLTWYFKKNLKNSMYISNRNDSKKLFKNLLAEEGFLKKLKSSTLPFASGNGYTAVLLKMPVFVMVTMFLFSDLITSVSYFEFSMLGPVLAAFVVYVLTNQKLFLFLGEAERYLNHVAIFIVLLFVDFVSDSEMFLLSYLLIAYGLAFYWYELKYGEEVLSRDKHKEASADALVKLLSTRSEENILLYPFHAAGGIFRILLETSHNVFFPPYLNKDALKHYEINFAANYPFVNLSLLDDIAQQYDISVVVLEKKHASKKLISDVWQPLAFDSDFYLVYERVNRSN